MADDCTLVSIKPDCRVGYNLVIEVYEGNSFILLTEQILFDEDIWMMENSLFHLEHDKLVT